MSNKCSIWVRNHNAWDASDGGQIAIDKNLPDLRWGGLGLDIVSSFIVKGPDENCKNKQAVAYAGHDYRGFSHYLTSYKRGTKRQIQNGAQNNMESLKFIDVPSSKDNHLVYDLPLDIQEDKLPLKYDSSKYCYHAHSSSPTIYGAKCFYKDDDDTRLRKLYNQVKNENSTNKYKKMSDTLNEKFCELSNNIFKNPGGGSCLEQTSARELAKEYCSVDDRIATDASCTPANLGNFYAGIAETYCKTTVGKADPWCSCYNVTNNVCDTDSAAAGCDIKRQQFDKLVEATPEGFRNVWSGKAACFGGVCQGDKYVPQNANQNCNAPVQICAQSFDLSQISESTIEAQCNLNAAGGTPSGTPSGGIGDYIPQSLGDVRNDSKKQLAVGGASALFMMCCCLLIIIVLMSSSGGGSSRFRR
jgi:hypothetical protein